MVICDVAGDVCPGMATLQQIRRVHPQLPLIAVLARQDFLSPVLLFAMVLMMS
jgi:DNA-binding NtrC family response regulator